MEFLDAGHCALSVLQNGLRCLLICLSLLQACLGRINLCVDPCERLLLCIKLGFRIVERNLVISGIKLEDHITSFDMLVGHDWDAFNIAGDFWCDRRNVTLHVSVIR